MNMEIDPAIDKVEFKFTALEADEGRVAAFLLGHPVEQREVYFYDTRQLVLSERGVILRGRVTDGAGATTVKLRPVEREVAVAAHERDEKVRIELDVVGADGTWSAKRDRDDVDPDAIAAGTWDELFSAKQQLLSGEVEFAELAVLGPIAARVWEIEGVLPFKLAAEEWSVGELHFIELSVKVDAADAAVARTTFRRFLGALVTNVEGDRSRKTERVLRALADPECLGAAEGDVGMERDLLVGDQP
jgi:hypothetical protein